MPPESHPMDPYRLPRTVVPTRYDLRLVPDIPAASFTGEETVAVTVGEPVAVFVLNAAELRIDRAELTLEWGEKRQGSVAPDGKEERCRLSFGPSVPAGNHRLFLSFAGT